MKNIERKKIYCKKNQLPKLIVKTIDCNDNFFNISHILEKKRKTILNLKKI